MNEVSFGEWLKRRRKAAGLTQEQLAQQISCSASALRKIEAEERRPSEQLAEQLAEVFSIPSNERGSFLKFARGYWEAAPTGVIKDEPWHKSIASVRSNLPVSLTSFIGREKEQAEILNLINKHRLVTLVGAGGVGKTRLSLKVGEQVVEDYAHGVWLVELAPILDPLLVPRTTSIAMGLRDEPQRPVIEMLSDYLREKQMLILLDNCEHLLDACAQLADRLLKNCPQLKILATSREAVGILGEALYQVPSLRVPDLQEVLETFRNYESIRLFEERAQLAQMDFSLTIENIFSVAKICSRLDGIPLAIELAVARVNMFSTEQIARQLQDNFNLLSTGNRTALPRHQTLRAAIDWSYDLLSPTEQILFQRLSVFVNGWTLEAVGSICSAANIKSEDVLDLLTQLIKKSLVNTEGIQSESRYRMLETIRQYAQEKLAQSGESNALRDRHLEYFLRLAETTEPHLRRAEQIAWLRQLDVEHENLRAALTWAMDKSAAQPALRLAGALATFWVLREYWFEGAKWLDQALSKEWDEKNQSEKAVRARALYRRADFALLLDELDLMKASAEVALKLCQDVEDSWGIAYSRAMVADYLYLTGNPRASKPLFEQSLNEFHTLGDAWGESLVSGWLVGTLIQLGEPQEEYLKMRQRAIASARLSGDRDRLALSLLGYANNLMAECQWDQAETVVQGAQQLLTEIDSSYGMNVTHSFYAPILFARGNYEKAKTEAKLYIEYCIRYGEKHSQAFSFLFLELIAEIEHDLQRAVDYGQKSLDLLREVGIERDTALCLSILGRLKYQEGNREISLQYLRESLTISEKDNMEGYWTPTIVCQIGGLSMETKPEVTVKLLGFTEVLWKKGSQIRERIFDEPYFDRFLAVARAKLSEAEFAAAWEAGLKMSMDQALNLAFTTIEEL